jgi:protease I
MTWMSKPEPLQGKTFAILATDGFEQSELFEPKKALEEAGAKVDVISFKSGEIKAWQAGNWGRSLAVDKVLSEALPDDYSGLILPGGVINADKMRADKQAVAFVRDFVREGKPIAAICHAPWILIEAGAVQGRTLTSWPSLRTDLENAGAVWTDSAVVVDRGLVTSRKPADIPAFNDKMIEEFGEGPHERRPGYVATVQPQARH